MKTNLFLILLATTTTVFAQNKSDEKPLRKIASGNGAQEINAEVEREVAKAMRDVKIDLKDLDIRINTQVSHSLEGLDERIESSLEGLDELIEHNLNASLEGLDETIEQSLRVLDDLDIDVNFQGNDNWVEDFRREALKDDARKDETKKDQPKTTPKKKE